MANIKIPKIIHQLWIGPKPAPIVFMNTWKEKHEPLGFEYKFWNEETIQKEIDLSKCGKKVNSIEEINGKADILRWEILYKFGGVFVDADSICIEPIDEYILNGVSAFAGWENETVRKGLIATGTMGFTPKHPIVYNALHCIYTQPVSFRETGNKAWFTVGPGLLTKVCNAFGFSDIKIYPSYYFLPMHYTGNKYEGHGKIYAYQEWGSTKQNYDNMNSITLPNEFTKMNDSVSILMSSLNSKQNHLRDCFESIKSQYGSVNIEVVIVNDGSDDIHTKILLQEIELFKGTSRFCSVNYINNESNKGLGYSLNRGLIECNNEIIFRMDTDDIMKPERIITQLAFMKQNPKCALCGSQVDMFRDDDVNNIVSTTRHVSIAWSDYKKNIRLQNNHWMMNHPTFCFRKSNIIEVGNYDDNIHSIIEDFDLILRVMKKFGKIYNLPKSLLKYRLHGNQLTSNSNTPKWKQARTTLVKEFIR